MMVTPEPKDCSDISFPNGELYPIAVAAIAMLEPLEDDRFRRANTKMPLQLARYAFELERRIILSNRSKVQRNSQELSRRSVVRQRAFATLQFSLRDRSPRQELWLSHTTP